MSKKSKHLQKGKGQLNYVGCASHMKPKTPEQILKRIMNDFSVHQRRSKEHWEMTKEMPKYFYVDYERMREIVQDNFQYFGVKIREWKRLNAGSRQKWTAEMKKKYGYTPQR